MAKRRRHSRRHSTKGLGSAISLRGLGKVTSSRGIMSFLLPTAVGVLVPAGVIFAARYFSDPAQSDTQKMIYKNAPWLGLAAGAVSSIALYTMGGGTAAAAASAVAATGVALTAFGAEQTLVRDPLRRQWAEYLNNPTAAGETALAVTIKAYEASHAGPADHAAAGLGNYFTMRPNGALGAAVPQLSGTGAVVMSPTQGLGYGAYSGGETVSLGSVNSEAFGTPGFRP